MMILIPEGRIECKKAKTIGTDSYASDDDEIPTKQVSQDIMEEISLMIDEAKLKKMADEMQRQNITPLVQSSQRDPEAPALSLINQDLLYLKKGNSGPEKIVLSLHKFPAIVFNDDDIEERTSIWLISTTKEVKILMQIWGVEMLEESSHAKINYISNRKNLERTEEIVARRANDCIVSITEPDYKNLNKNDIEDMYLLIMNNKYGYVQKELTNDELEFLKLFEEEIEVRLKYRDQMRRWEIVAFFLMASSSPTSSSTNVDNLVREGLSSNVTLSDSLTFIERISKKRMKSKAKTTKPDSEWKRL
ncbi:hypothetical protein Tco_1386841 [Tanacetum coccineum]